MGKKKKSRSSLLYVGKKRERGKKKRKGKGEKEA